MNALRVGATVLVALLIASFTMLGFTPDVSAQEQYLRPVSTLNHDEPCPTGTSVLWRVEGGIQYCTAPADYAPISTATDCTAAGAALGGLAIWIADASVCMGGGLFPVATAADCSGTLFLEGVMIGSFTSANACVIQLYLFAPAPPPVPTATAGSGPAAPARALVEIGLTATDPYICGEGFNGTIVNGTAPFIMSYGIENAASSFSLPSFTASDAAFTTPADYIPYGMVPDATYNVNIRITDSSYPVKSLALEGFAKAEITQNCGELTTAAVPVAVSATAQPSELAVTGPTSNRSFQLSQAALGLGLSLLATARLVTVRRRKSGTDLRLSAH